MAYVKTVYVNDNPPAINADNLNKSEQGILDAHQGISDLRSALNAIECPSQNLFALAGFKKNSVLSTSDGTTETYNAASGHTIEYTALEKDKKYSMSAPEDTNVRIFYYNSSKVKTDTAVVNAKTFTYTPTADMYVRFQCTNEIAESGNVQFEEGERSAYVGEKSAVDSIIRKNFNEDKQEKDAKISDIDSIIAIGVFSSVADASLAGNGWVNKSNGQLITKPAYSYKYKKLIVDSTHLYYIRSATISGSAAAMLNYYNSSDEYLGYEYDSSTGSEIEYSNILITPPENTAYIIVVAVGDFSVYTNYINMTNQTYWMGKKILWLGTSIPATAFNGGQAYPQIVGENIGATVRNNALSGSFARRRFDPAHIDDPSMTNIDMNWGMRSLSTSENEIDDIATNWSTYKSHFANAPDTLSAETIAQWKAWSYETLLDPYISESDLIVFDMGRNDYASVMNDPEAPYDKYYFVGAMDFLIKHIYETNPRKRICMIAHYENQDHGSDLFSKIVENQLIVSNFWSIPIFRLDKMLGWSNKSITTKHNWVQHGSNWVFEETEDSHTMPIYHAWLEDNLHPYLDSTGEATYLIANAITQWIKTIV